MDLKLGNTSFQYHEGEIYQATLIFESAGEGEFMHNEVVVLEGSLDGETLSDMTPKRLEELGRDRMIKIIKGDAKNETYDIDLAGMSSTKMQRTAKMAQVTKTIGDDTYGY